jgi:hypothetical protein
MIDFNRDELTVEVTEYFTWDHVERHFGTIITDISQFDDEDCEDNKDAIENFLEDCQGKELTKEEKAEIMECILDYWDFNNDETSTLWDSDVIREGIFQWIEDNYHCDLRYDDLTHNWW